MFVLQLIQIATGHTHSNNLLYSMCDQALLFVIGWSNLVWQMVPTTFSLQGGSSRPVPNQRGRSGDISGHHNIGDIWIDKGLLLNKQVEEQQLCPISLMQSSSSFTPCSAAHN